MLSEETTVQDDGQFHLQQAQQRRAENIQNERRTWFQNLSRGCSDIAKGIKERARGEQRLHWTRPAFQEHDSCGYIVCGCACCLLHRQEANRTVQQCCQQRRPKPQHVSTCSKKGDGHQRKSIPPDNGKGKARVTFNWCLQKTPMSILTF